MKTTLIRAFSQLSFLMLVSASLCVEARTGTGAPSLLPVPAEMQKQPGHYQPGARLRVVLEGNGEDLNALGKLGAEILRANWQREVDIVVQASGERSDLVLSLTPDPGASGEKYALRVERDGIRLQAPSQAGLFYGLQSLRQLLEQSDPKAGLGRMAITDAPRFAWRGLHLDVARHMFPVDYIKRQLDLMARYKFNTLHLHLTDDQGWRLQIQRYPKLTRVGAWRTQSALRQADGTTRYDGKRYGGFYTQAQAREIVAYASALHITVVPEIEMPGHTVAALAAYPELACTPGPFEVRVDWGVDENVLCPNEKSFEFMKNVLDEVMAIFPSTYIHVGGDEAPIIRWQQSELAQSIIRREGLKDEHALQGWFMRRIDAYLKQHGRRVLAWDEMLAGDPDKSTTIMAWRNVGEGIKAAQRGYDVVMTPVSYSYFDYCQSRAVDEPYCPLYLPLEQVYDFDPVPAELTAAQAKHVLGGQANLWTEHISTPEHAEFMLWPRALAMAEVLWSPIDVRSWESFKDRLAPQFAALTRLGVNYRIPEVEGLDGDVLSLRSEAIVALRSPMHDAQILVTTDGSQPRIDSSRYTGPLRLPLSDTPVTVSARLLTASGALGPTMRASYAKTALKPSRAVVASLRGLRRDYFEGEVGTTDALLTAQPRRSDVVEAIGIPDFAPQEKFGLRYQGLLQIPVDGVYRFALTSDDGARLLIDDAVLIDRDGLQSPGLSYGSIGLAKGAHAFELRYFQGGGDRSLRLDTSRDGGPSAPVPTDWWQHQR